MSTRSFADGRKLIGNKTSAKGRLDAAVLAGVEPLERRQMLNAQVLPQNFTVPNPSGSTPLPVQQGKTFYVNGNGTSNAWQWNSAVTPNTVNDLVLNVTAYNQNFTGCCEGTNSAVGNTGSVNNGRLLTNGLTQNQVGGFPANGAVAATGSGNNSDASSGESVLSQNGSSWYLEYNLGAAPGQTPSSTGYDISEIDVIAGHQDYRTGMQNDILVQYVGGNATDWFSLSNNNNFNFTAPTRGSAQMAIQSPGGPIASNVRAVKFFAANRQTWYRELVVTGVPSASTPGTPAIPGTPLAVADPTPGAIDVVFNPSVPNAESYAVQRALVTNGVPGAFSTIGGLVTTVTPTTFVDTTGAAGSVYVYQIVATNGSANATSAQSNQFATPLVGAEAHYYNMAYWEGPVTVSQGVAVVQLNWPNGNQSNGIRTSVNSAVITGKFTPTVSGTYTLYSNTDDDGYLYVNGALVSSDPGGHGQRNAGSAVDINNVPIGFAKPIFLNAGTGYDFVLLEHNSGGGAGANLVWTTPSSITQVVPSTLLSPTSDAPIAPTNLTVDASTLNSNFVNFTFTAENKAVVHYILQRQVVGTTNWTTVDQIDPGSDGFTVGGDIATATPHQFMTIQDASPVAGATYTYRVAALNYDGIAVTPTVQATLATAADLASPPAGAVTLSTGVDAGSFLGAGTYFVKFAWINATGGITAASTTETSIITTGVGDVKVALPAAPAGAVNGNIYLSSATGQERLVGTVAGLQTLTVKGLPITSAAAAPTANTAGLVAGTYFVAYTWAGNEITVTGESSSSTISNTTRLIVSDEASIVLAGTNDVVVSGFPAAPTGVGNVNVYIGTSTGGERFAGSVSPTGSLIISALPLAAAKPLPAGQINNTAAVSGTVTPIVIPALSGTNPAGVEIHAYNQELSRRTPQSSTLAGQLIEVSSFETFANPAEYIAQITNQTYAGGPGAIYAGPIDRDYGAIVPNFIPQPGPSSPDPVKFPDVERIHTESFAQVFTGVLTPSVSGIYTIIGNSDDDGYVWLDGTLISADPGGHGQQDTNFPTAVFTNAPSRTQDTLIPVFLVAGQSYNLTMFMNNTGGGSGTHLKWVEPPAFGGANTGVILFGSNADQSGATLSFNDPSNSFINGNYNNFTVFITSGPGSGQAGIISNYNTATRQMTVNVTTNGNASLWSTIPTSASKFVVSWVSAVPLKGSDPYPVSTVGGLQLHEGLPVQGTWSTSTGVVTLTTSASAAQNVTISQLSPTAGVSLSWADQGLSELWYEVQRSTDGVNFSSIGTTAMNVGTTFSDPSAANAFGSPTISYFYRVRGVNFDGAGPFSPVVNTNNGVNIAGPTLVNLIQGAPGTAGIVFAGGSPNAGGLDVQYATLNAGVTGSFVDATPLGLPFNTFDFQVTGLTASQQYVFKARNLPGGNNTSTTLFGTPVAFTPTGGIQESFGTPGSGIGGFVGTGSTIGDVIVNTNSSLTGVGVAAPATPATSPVVANPQDLTTPFAAFVSVTSATDAPAPTDAGTFATSSNNLDVSGVSSVFLEYTWVTANGETLPFSTPVSFTLPPGNGALVTYTIPSAPAGFGITNANIYMGSSSSPSAEHLSATVAPGGTFTITTLAATTAKSVPTSSTTGIPAGTYFLKYTWTNAANQQTLPSPEQTFVLTNPSNDLTVQLPVAPTNATNSSIYISTVVGGERLVGSAGIGATPTIIIRGMPGTTATTPPTVNSVGLPAGTYFVQYSWNGTLPNENSTNEGLASPITSIVVTTGQDVAVTIPATPLTGAGNANVYIGTGLNVHSPVVPVTLGQQADAASTLPASTYFVKYTWKVGTGETSPSAEQSFVVSSTLQDLLVSLPAAPVGATNANVYISTNSGGEKLAGNFAGGTTATIAALPSTSAAGTPAANTEGLFLSGQAVGGTTFFARTIPTTGNRPPIPGTVQSGPAAIAAVPDSVVAPSTTLTIQGTSPDGASTLVTGTYYVQYTWTGSNGETTASPEQTVTIDATGPGDIFAQVPTGPAGSGNANIYLGTAAGAERFLQSAAGNHQTVIKSLPATNAVAAPATSTVALPAGTYYVAYSWTSNNSLETAGSTEQTIVAPANSDITVVPPVNPVGAGAARIYFGSNPGQEFFVNTANSLATLSINSVPTINSKLVPNTASQLLRLQSPANALQVTNNNGGQAGNAFNLGENIAGFTTSFDFELTGNTSADGLGIVFQPSARTLTGGSGGAMSFNGTTPGLPRSVGIFFDTFQGNGTGRTGIGINGSTPATWLDLKSISGVPTGVAITNSNNADRHFGEVFNATIAYNNTTHIITETVYNVSLKNRGVNNSFTTTYSIDLVAAIGMPAAYVGFTGGTGGEQAEHDVLNWSFSNATTIPLDTITGTAGVDQITLTKDGSNIDWTLNGGPQVFTLPINDPNGLTINGLGSNDVITLNNTAGNPLPNLLKLNGRFTINGLQGTNPLAGTTVDIGTSTVFIPYGSPGADPITLIKGYLQNGYNGNTWTGTATPTTGAIRSSGAAVNPNAFSIGYADSADVGNPANIAAANTIELRYAGVGDTNLNDTVDANDYAAVVRGFGTGTTWDQGVVTYDGIVSANDYAAVVRAFGTVVTAQAPTPAATPAAAPAVITAKATNSGLANATASVTLSSSSSSSTSSTDSSNHGTGSKKKPVKPVKVKKHHH